MSSKGDWAGGVSRSIRSRSVDGEVGSLAGTLVPKGEVEGEGEGEVESSWLDAEAFSNVGMRGRFEDGVTAKGEGETGGEGIGRVCEGTRLLSCKVQGSSDCDTVDCLYKRMGRMLTRSDEKRNARCKKSNDSRDAPPAMQQMHAGRK